MLASVVLDDEPETRWADFVGADKLNSSEDSIFPDRKSGTWAVASGPLRGPVGKPIVLHLRVVTKFHKPLTFCRSHPQQN